MSVYHRFIGRKARMSPTTQVLLSGALTFGVPLVLAFRELHLLRRPGGKAGWGGDPVTPPSPPPRPADGEPPRKPLPDCLIVAAQGAPLRLQERERELV
jgi:hypothetical protein